jgi:hypothetical protein
MRMYRKTRNNRALAAKNVATGWRSQLTFGFEKGRQAGSLSRPRQTQASAPTEPVRERHWLDKMICIIGDSIKVGQK